MDIYETLKKDHDEMKRILNELCSLDDQDEARKALIDRIENLLVPHSRAEESVFYNTLRAIDADKKLAAHGYKEHMQAETLLRSLQGMSKMNSGWKGTAEKLRDAVFHHIEDEETEIFDEARSALSDEEAASLGQAFASLKPKMQEQGATKNMMEMVKNMMPPRFADKVRDLGSESRPS